MGRRKYGRHGNQRYLRCKSCSDYIRELENAHGEKSGSDYRHRDCRDESSSSSPHHEWDEENCWESSSSSRHRKWDEKDRSESSSSSRHHEWNKENFWESSSSSCHHEWDEEDRLESSSSSRHFERDEEDRLESSSSSSCEQRYRREKVGGGESSSSEEHHRPRKKRYREKPGDIESSSKKQHRRHSKKHRPCNAGGVSPSDCKELADIIGGAIVTTTPACVVQRLRDINAKILGCTTRSPLALPFALSFEDCRNGDTLNLGETVVLQEEINPLLTALRERGIIVTAVHNHWLFDEPRLMYMHWIGVGNPFDFARDSIEAAREAGLFKKHRRR